jgi:hypothetical protein
MSDRHTPDVRKIIGISVGSGAEDDLSQCSGLAVRVDGFFWGLSLHPPFGNKLD